MSWRATSWASEQLTGSAITKGVLWKLADNANDEGVCWPSIPTIARHTELSVRTVQTHMAHLEALGLIWVERRTAGAVNLPNVYHLRMPGSVDRDGTVVQGMHQGGGAADAPVPQRGPGVVQPDAPGGAATRTTRTANEPSKNRHSLTPADAGESDGSLTLGKGSPERFRDFRQAWAETMPGGFPAKDEAAAEAEWLRQTRMATDPDRLIAAVRLHGRAEGARAAKYRGGDFRTKLPSNWLKDRGFQGYLAQADVAAAAGAEVSLALARVRQALGDQVVSLLRERDMPDTVLAMLDGMTLDAGPPPVLTACKPMQRHLLDKHMSALDRRLGGNLTLVMASSAKGAA